MTHCKCSSKPRVTSQQRVLDTFDFKIAKPNAAVEELNGPPSPSLSSPQPNTPLLPSSPQPEEVPMQVSQSPVKPSRKRKAVDDIDGDGDGDGPYERKACACPGCFAEIPLWQFPAHVGTCLQKDK